LSTTETRTIPLAEYEVLLSSERTYRLLIENSQDVIYTIDATGILTFVSPSWQRVLGHRPREVLGKLFKDFIHPEDLPVCQAWIHSAIKMGTCPNGQEYRILHADGTWRWHTSNVTLLLDGAGTITGFEGIARDITESRRAEDALEESQRNLQSVFDAIDETICFMERNGTILAANTTFAARLGRTAEECLGKDAYSMLSPELARSRRASVEEVFTTGKPVAFDDIRTGRWIHQVLYPVLDASGRTSRIVIYATDITEQKNMLESLRVSEALYRTLFEVSPMGLTISDSAGIIMESNRLASSLLGLTAEEHLKRSISGHEWKLVRPDGSPMPPAEFASTRALKEHRLVENVEMGIINADDVTTWLNVAAAPVPLEGYGVVIAYYDITGRKSAEKRIQDLLNEKDIILKEAHHRIKNNLSAINGLLRLQADEIGRSDCTEILLDAAGRVQSMMLLYEKLYHSGGSSELAITEYLPPLIEQIQVIFDTDKKIRTAITIEEFMLSAKALSALGIIINEMMTNSMKYAFKGAAAGSIRVSARKMDACVTIEYEDDGIGLPEGISLENSTGFGMRLIGMLVEQLHGTVRIEREHGTRFVITFAV
jgi:PAS domain S-box-containing protein